MRLIVSKADAGVPSLSSSQVESDPRWQLVSHIIASSLFAKSHKLKDFLSYICEQTLLGNSDALNEQTIGIEVFGKSPGYASSEDNIVRAHATRLRQKLDSYFYNEGVHEPLRIIIPKGGYVPTFYTPPRLIETDPTSNTVEAPDGAVGKIPEEIEAGETQTAAVLNPPLLVPPNFYWVITAVACLLCVSITWLAINRFHHPPTTFAAQANRIFWSKFLGDGQQTIVVVGDSSLDLYENVTERNLGVSDYVSGQYRTEPTEQSLIDPHELRKIARRRLTSIVDLDTAIGIVRRPEAAQNIVSIQYARDLHVDDLKQSNLILIGAQEANPWVELYESSLNFSILPDQKTKIFTILNRSPKPGEQPQYQSHPGDPSHHAYALVALLPNLTGRGYALIIQGTAMAGTEAAADFVLRQPKLESMLHLSAAPNVPLPKFEFLLETSNINGNAPSSRIVASRVNGR